jgi:hypothetical protein
MVIFEHCNDKNHRLRKMHRLKSSILKKVKINEKTFMSEGGDDVEGLQINNVFYICRSVKNGLHLSHGHNVHNNNNNRKQNEQH